MILLYISCFVGRSVWLTGWPVDGLEARKKRRKKKTSNDFVNFTWWEGKNMELDQLSTDFGGHDTKGERKTWTGIPRFYLSPDRKEKKKNGVVFACRCFINSIQGSKQYLFYMSRQCGPALWGLQLVVYIYVCERGMKKIIKIKWHMVWGDLYYGMF